MLNFLNGQIDIVIEKGIEGESGGGSIGVTGVAPCFPRGVLDEFFKAEEEIFRAGALVEAESAAFDEEGVACEEVLPDPVTAAADGMAGGEEGGDINPAALDRVLVLQGDKGGTVEPVGFCLDPECIDRNIVFAGDGFGKIDVIVVAMGEKDPFQ